MPGPHDQPVSFATVSQSASRKGLMPCGSAVPMAARGVNKVGLESNPQNYLLMHAMGPNVAGVIGSAVAAGLMIMLVGG